MRWRDERIFERPWPLNILGWVVEWTRRLMDLKIYTSMWNCDDHGSCTWFIVSSRRRAMNSFTSIGLMQLNSGWGHLYDSWDVKFDTYKTKSRPTHVCLMWKKMSLSPRINYDPLLEALLNIGERWTSQIKVASYASKFHHAADLQTSRDFRFRNDEIRPRTCFLRTLLPQPSHSRDFVFVSS